MQKKFQKKVENFQCGICKTKVEGNGFTNHCPKCLYSKHVDVNPGDRQERCHGFMKPIGVFLKNGKQYLQHRCEKCKALKNNQVAKEDSREALLRVAQGKIYEE